MTSPSLLDRCERRFGHLAIPGLPRILAIFQVLCFILIYVNPQYVSFLMLSPAAWQEGEIWRFITFCFIPRNLGLLWIVFVISMLVSIGNQLEAHWGKFRLNLYFAATVICLWGAVALAGPVMGYAVGVHASSLLYSSLFLAFAAIAPDYVILVYMILPVKAKWLGILDGAFLLHLFVTQPLMRMPILIALIPFACFALPVFLRNLRRSAKVGSRRALYKANSIPAGDPFHECYICHRTEHSDPSIEFRIAENGEEYCAEHLPKSANP